jgi:Eukaryotic protein of unknown function (DUF829)
MIASRRAVAAVVAHSNAQVGASPRLIHNSATVGRFLVSSSSDQCGVSNQRDRPVVLFGWVGAKDKAVQRYSAVFHEAGASRVYRHVAKTSDIFLREKELERTAHETLEYLQANYPQTPVSLAYFSNGGCFIHEQISLLWKEDQHRPLHERRYKDVRISAFVFDSCPAHLSLAAGSRALTGFIKNDVLRAIAFCFTFAVFSVFIPLFWGLGRPKKYFKNLIEDPFTNVPSLYIYSDSDRITCPKELTKFVEDRRKFVAKENPSADATALIQQWHIGKEVNSPHVSHLIAQPKEYSKRISDFLRDSNATAAKHAELR